MKKKIALALIGTMIAATMATGCSGDKKDPADKDSTTSTESVKDDSSSTESSSTSTEETVDVSVLYKKSEYETLKYSDYVKIGDLTNLIKINESDYVVTDEEVKKEIDYYLDLHGEKVQNKEGKVADKDTVNIDFVGKIDGKEIEGGSAKDYNLVIGSKTFINGFESGLVGKTIGETVDLNLKFPDDYKDGDGKISEYAGKDVTFSVTINYVAGETIPAEYTDDLVKKITNEDYSTTDEFTSYIKKYLESQKKQNIMNNFKEALLEKIEFTGDISKYTDEEYQNGVDYYTTYAKNSDYTLEEFANACGYKTEQELLDYIKEDSEKYVKEKIALYAYGESIKFELTDEMVKAGAEDIVALYGYGSLENLVTQYNASIVRFDIYGDKIADKIIETYK